MTVDGREVFGQWVFLVPSKGHEPRGTFSSWDTELLNVWADIKARHSGLEAGVATYYTIFFG